jgi:MFS family permease
VTDGSAWSVMVGIGEQYLAAFALALSLGPVASAWVTTVPPIVGGVLQLATPAGVRLVGSPKRWTVLTAVVQACAFIPMIIGALLGALPAWTLYLCATVYYGMGYTCGASWSTWISTIVPHRVRAKFFGMRQRTLQIGTLIGFLLGAGLLSLFTGNMALKEVAEPARVLPLFALLFAIAMLCRMFSAFMLSRQSEPKPGASDHRRVPLGEVVQRTMSRGRKGHRDGKLLAYIFAIFFASNVGTPFVVPYFLDHLRMSYMESAVLIGCVMLGKVIALPLIGRWAHRLGPGRVLLIGGLAIVPLGFFFTISASFGYLLVVQLYSGVAWACYDLSAFLLLLRHTREEERTSVASVNFMLQAVALFAGSLVGGTLMNIIDPATEKGHAAYMGVFLASSFLRVLTILLLIRITREHAHDTDDTPPGPVPPTKVME